MALFPASCQGKPLRDSYRHFGESYGGGWQRYAEQMIEVIPFIEGVCADLGGHPKPAINRHLKTGN